jgi:serine/threonine-protein kinase HipA
MAKDGEILFATERYDRIFDPEGSAIDGLIRPLRLHQEDFAQALGISSAGKYESPGEEYLKAAFHLLASCSSDPIRDQLRLWDLVIFDYLVGNTDNHLKNISLLYDKNLAGIHLAPAYDIVSTAVYESCIRDMGMSIGGEFSLDRISRDSFADEAKKVGLGTRMALEHFDRLKENFRAALTDAADTLEKQGFSAAEMICGQILKNGSRQMTR